MLNYGVGGEIRTLMPLRALRPEHSVSTNSTTSASERKNKIIDQFRKAVLYFFLLHADFRSFYQ